ncbi:MAG TPA: GntR family transcriptional regulator, partial [Thermoanaerobaculia bacterium]|nr:GntR family transcriptional regulator [Thermoanaerobaculia bacterium]
MSSQLDWPGAIDLDRGSRESLSDQLAAALERRISSGALSEGARLPATRDLAAALKINRGTVQ